MEKRKLAKIVKNYYLGEKGKIFGIKNLLKKKDKDSIYKLRDSMINVVKKKLISYEDLEEFIKENHNSPEEGLVATVRDFISGGSINNVKAVGINSHEKYGFIGCRGNVKKDFGKKIY